MSEESIEKRLVRSQHAVKTFESTRNSWFVAIPKLFLQYNLPDCWDVVDNPPSKFQWKSLVDKHVNDYCVERIKSRVSLYSSLEYLTADEYYPGKKHWILQQSSIVRDVPGIHVKLMLWTSKDYVTLIIPKDIKDRT